MAKATASKRKFQRTLDALAAAALCFAGVALAQTTPEQDRAQFIAYLQQRFTGIPLDDYVHGAMIANPDGKAQYDKIMEFPPFLGDIERGKKLWETPFRNGKTFAGCYPNGGRNVLGNYPYFDEARGKVVTFEMSLNDCLKRNGEPVFDYGGRDTMGVLTAHARSLSDGTRLNIKVASAKAREKYAEGRALFFQRTGQLNASCSGCHYDNAGQIMRMEIISPVLGHATHWPIFRGGEELMTFQGRFKRCLEQMRAIPHGYASEEWNNLEYFLSYLSNGLPLQANVFRK